MADREHLPPGPHLHAAGVAGARRRRTDGSRALRALSRAQAERSPGRRSRVIRRAVVVVGGFVLLAAGGLLMVLPGPGIPLVVAGLGLLSLEFEWARRLRLYTVHHARRIA